jgi:hypothetical protein
MSLVLAQAFGNGILDKDVHSRLVQNLPHYCERAGVSDIHIASRMSQFGCSVDEIEYVKSIKRRPAVNQFGLVYGDTTALTRMQAVAGACVRNFVDAKVMTLAQIFASIKEFGEPEATVLCIPDFYAGTHKTPEWRVQELLGLLYARKARSQQTFVFVSNADDLRTAYGDPVADHVKKFFKSVG